MIFKNVPENFNPKFEAVGCFLECDGKILLLHRQDYKSEGNTWGLPSGKVEVGEDFNTAMRRELKEEARLGDENIKYIGKIYVKFTEYDIMYHIFRLILQKRPEIAINKNEHKDFRWVLPDEALEMDLIENLGECIDLIYGNMNL